MRRGLALLFLLCLTACAQMVTTEPARLESAQTARTELASMSYVGTPKR